PGGMQGQPGGHCTERGAARKPIMTDHTLSSGLSPTIALACELIRRRSVTPEDDSCQDIMIHRLEAIGFRVERLRFGDVDNFWARRGDSGPLLAFAGHTDVVPSGPEEQWQHPPDRKS